MTSPYVREAARRAGISLPTDTGPIDAPGVYRPAPSAERELRLSMPWIITLWAVAAIFVGGMLGFMR